MQHFHFHSVLFRDPPDLRQALLHALVGNEAHVGAEGRRLGQHVVGVRSGQPGKGDGRLQHGSGLRIDDRSARWIGRDLREILTDLNDDAPISFIAHQQIAPVPQNKIRNSFIFRFIRIYVR